MRPIDDCERISTYLVTKTMGTTTIQFHRPTVRAEVITSGPKHDTAEQIVTRLSFELGIAAVSWFVVPTMME